MRGSVLFVLLALVAPLFAVGSVQEPAKKDADSLTVFGTDGKETTVKKWKILRGTRKIAAEPEPIKPADKGEKPAVKWPAAKEFLEFREDNSTDYKEGILTLVPMSSLRKVDYDEAKKTVAATCIDADGKEVVLSGTTKYVGINKLFIEAIDEETAKHKFQGGMTNVKPPIRGFRFAASQPAPKVSGSLAVVVGVDKAKTVHKIQDLKALYRTGGVERISSFVLFKKDAKVEASKIVKLRKAPPEKGKKEIPLEYEVTLADGKQVNMLLVKDVFPDNGLPATFLGLIGKVQTGYKLFPLHTFAEVRREGD